MNNVLITGANGFIGSALCETLLTAGFNVKGTVRRPVLQTQNAGVKYLMLDDISAQTQWTEALAGVDVVIHLAARVHIMQETASNPDALFIDVNLEGSKNLALQAVASGVKRFIYISTIKVNGEGAEAITCSETTAAPCDAYAASKWQAERALNKIAGDTGLDVVIIRPPLVYGPGVKGNFLRLLKLVEKGLPIPLGAVVNKRSMVYVANLCHLIKLCISHPNAPGHVFLVSDNNDLSTPALIGMIASALNHSERLLSIPVSWLFGCAKWVGKEAEIQRLCGSLQVDISNTMEILSWQPPYTVQQGVQKTAEWFLHSYERKL